MQMSDTRQIAVPPAEVYAALLDADTLKRCVPGAQEVTGSPEEGFEATVVQKVGPVKATFKGEVTISDMVPNQSLKIDGSGKGGAAGFAKGGADVTLTADGKTDLSTWLELSLETEALMDVFDSLFGRILCKLGRQIKVLELAQTVKYDFIPS